jgi:hypothetical protein
VHTSPNYSRTQRLRATIFEIADSVQCRNAATTEGRCPILRPSHKLSANRSDFSHLRRETRNISNASFAFSPLASGSSGTKTRYL